MDRRRLRTLGDIEDEEEIISNVIYEDDDKEEIKTTLVKMWYRRLKIMQEQQ